QGLPRLRDPHQRPGRGGPGAPGCGRDGLPRPAPAQGEDPPRSDLPGARAPQGAELRSTTPPTQGRIMAAAKVSDGLTISWCTNPGAAQELADFFIRGASPDYISHGEIQTGRAGEPGRWLPDVADVVAEEIREAAAAGGADGGPQVLVARLNGDLVALAIVSFHLRDRNSFAVVE